MKATLVGMGSVGRALVTLLAQRQRSGGHRPGTPEIRAVVDSRGARLSRAGQPLDLEALVAAKAQGVPVHRAEAAGGLGVEAGGPEWSQRLIAESGTELLIEAGPTDLKRPATAMGHLRAAMASGMHVVCVNKAPLATAMPALLELAAYNRVGLRFSGCVGAGTPVLAMGEQLARGDRVRGISAVVNGTTNYILTQMRDAGQSFGEALAGAQQLGYAEADPSGDVDGWDTAMKMVILAAAVMGVKTTVGRSQVEGISKVTREAMAEAAARGKTIKLVGRAGEDGVSVGPAEVDRHGPLDVAGSTNAVVFRCDTLGEVTLSGRGAGGPETATAILRDAEDLAKAAGADRGGR